LNFVIELV